jgi:hypothetical protein
MFRDNKCFRNDVTELLAIAMNDYLITILQPVEIRKWPVGARAVTTDDNIALGSQRRTPW